MATVSNRSSGTQPNAKGVTQGVTLVDPKTGLPVGVVTDGAGVPRLAVDANLTADNITVDTRELAAATDAVRIEDPVTGAHVRVETDGSVNANIHTSAFSGTPDSELFVGTEDGTAGGTKHVAKINSNGSLATTNIAQLVTVPFDSIVASYPTYTQEVYVYKTGGTGGTTVATVTVNYVDAEKDNITSVVRT